MLVLLGAVLGVVYILQLCSTKGAVGAVVKVVWGVAPTTIGKKRNILLIFDKHKLQNLHDNTTANKIDKKCQNNLSQVGDRLI